jgi:S-adenosylmethionine decarboxylase
MEHGRHIKVIGTASSDRLRDAGALRTMLQRLVASLEMRCLGSPHIYEVEEEISKLNSVPFEDEGGVTGVVVLSTSHCAIHTWPLRSYFVMDIYSCRSFDPVTAVRLLQAHLEPVRLKVTDLSDSLVPDAAWEEPAATGLPAD